MTSPHYDALLMVGFGGPEAPADVIPFLENVLRGKNVPRERLLEVAEHYHHFGGISPINGQMRDLIAALTTEFSTDGLQIPIYWGNRNWHPLLAETVRAMADAGVRRALAYVTSAYSSYSGCRQYREDIQNALDGLGSADITIDKVRVFYNHPLFIQACADRLSAGLERLPQSQRHAAQVVFTAHSIPQTMARTCDYERQLRETCRLTAETCSLTTDRWQLVYQSRSGRPEDPWLAPDICEHLRSLPGAGVQQVVVMPIGFLSDHMEVLYDLDDEARRVADELGLHMVRASTVGTHPLFVRMIRELVLERWDGKPDREAIGQYPANHDVCPVDCCPNPRRPPPK
ncbi:MAG: ferrochelatase [Planctomycetales bacterium]